MTDALVPRARPESRRSAAVERLFVLEASGGGRIHSMSPDGSDRKVIVTGAHLPDGIVVDTAAGHIQWTNMGSSPGTNVGSIESEAGPLVDQKRVHTLQALIGEARRP
jgi:hypothetical protein